MVSIRILGTFFDQQVALEGDSRLEKEVEEPTGDLQQNFR